MSEQEMRLKCLELASQSSPHSALDIAAMYWDYVRTGKKETAPQTGVSGSTIDPQMSRTGSTN